MPTCSLTVKAALELTVMVTTSPNAAQTKDKFARQTQAGNLLRALEDCDASDDAVGCRAKMIGNLRALITDIATGGETECYDDDEQEADAAAPGCSQYDFQSMVNQYPNYEPKQSEYGADQLNYCRDLAREVPAHFDETTCCAILDKQAEYKQHCGPRPSTYLPGRMSWGYGNEEGMWIASKDDKPGYRFLPDECSANRLKLKPLWQDVDLESDDWRLSALVRLLAGVEGDYVDMVAQEFIFQDAYGSLIETGSPPNSLESLPIRWRGFPVYVNPTCSRQGASVDCSFVFIWIATHSSGGDDISGDAHGRAVVSRSHPALIYWRALSEPRADWDCDGFGDQCKYDSAHPDDCIDYVTFPAKFSWGGARQVGDSLGSAAASWRSATSGAVVFSEALFGARPKSATIDLIDGFEVNCGAGTTYEAADNGTYTGTTLVTDDDGDIEEESRVLETLGTLFDTIGPLALPLVPLVVAYVAFDEITDAFKPTEVRKDIEEALDAAARPFVQLFERLFDVLFG